MELKPLKNKNIQKEFLTGVQEIYHEMFTNQVMLRLMDLEETKVSKVYNESQEKHYLAPIQLVAKVVYGLDKSDLPEIDRNDKGIAVFTVPTQDLIDNGIDFSPSQYHYLAKSIVIYKGDIFDVDWVMPNTNVADEYITFSFITTKRYKQKTIPHE